MNRIAILGGRGMLGTDVNAACQAGNIQAAVLDLPEFDITNSDDIAGDLRDIDMIVNCAAYTNVDKAESETEPAYKINAEAVGRLAAFCRDNGKWLLHISTDFVFDGTSERPYIETDPPNPINAYGKSKLEGEKLLVESKCPHCIMRVQWTFGMSGNNFIKKLLALAKQGKDLKVVDDQIGSPTATEQAAKVIVKLLKKKPQGLFHFAADGYVNRFEMAKFIFEKLNMKVNLSPCKSSEFVSAAQRPLNSSFNCTKIKALLGEPIEHWQGPLERFLRQL